MQYAIQQSLLLPNLVVCPIRQIAAQVMPDDHSKLVPPLPIPNRTVKQFCADDSAATSVKVGYRQACYMKKPLIFVSRAFCFAILLLLYGIARSFDQASSSQQ
jgi:hypothetical protein